MLDQVSAPSTKERIAIVQSNNEYETEYLLQFGT